MDLDDFLGPYKSLLGHEVIDQLFQIAELLKGKKIVTINSTKEGGGVAEILNKMVPLINHLGIEMQWEIMEGNADFYKCTKMFHNLLQGKRAPMPNASLLKVYEEVNAQNAEKFRPLIENADIVLIHDPQPLAMIHHFPEHKAKWMWRCHVETSNASRVLWNYLKKSITKYDASIFSLVDFTQLLSHPIYVVPPSIDPFSEKNIDLDEQEVNAVYKQLGIDNKRPTLLQVSRFDHFKDPLGVIEAYRIVKKYHNDLQLILAGGGATDDPEGQVVLDEVMEAAAGDKDIHILNLPSDAHRTINALQRGATIVLQKSTKEGFGLTVTEAMWKMKPVIGGNTGGIRLQLINHHTGFLVNTPEGAAHRIRYLLQNPEIAKEIGIKAKHFVKENFLITRHIREYLTAMTTLFYPDGDRIDLSRHVQ